MSEAAHRGSGRCAKSAPQKINRATFSIIRTLVRKLDKDLWEVRVHLEDRIARVLFTVSAGKIVLLHGFIKKSQATPKHDLDLSKDRMRSK